jgi:hypothetical protein
VSCEEWIAVGTGHCANAAGNDGKTANAARNKRKETLHISPGKKRLNVKYRELDRFIHENPSEFTNMSSEGPKKTRTGSPMRVEVTVSDNQLTTIL